MFHKIIVHGMWGGSLISTVLGTKVKRPRVILPAVHMHEHGAWYQHLIELTMGIVPIRTAVVHPVDENVLLGAAELMTSKV